MQAKTINNNIIIISSAELFSKLGVIDKLYWKPNANSSEFSIL